MLRAHHPAATDRPGVQKSLSTLHGVKGSNAHQHWHLCRVPDASVHRPGSVEARADRVTGAGAIKRIMDQFSGPSAGRCVIVSRKEGWSASTGRNDLAGPVMVGPLRGVPIGQEAGHARIQVESLERAGPRWVPMSRPASAARVHRQGDHGNTGAPAGTHFPLLRRAFVEEKPSHRLG